MSDDLIVEFRYRLPDGGTTVRQKRYDSADWSNDEELMNHVMKTEVPDDAQSVYITCGEYPDDESEALPDLTNADIVRLLAAQKTLMDIQPEYREAYLANIEELSDRYGVDEL